jgi:hypothetical protein
MKGQDIGLLLKLVCLERHFQGNAVATWPHDWRGWDEAADDGDDMDSAILRDVEGAPRTALYTARALEEQTGISKSQIALALKRCIEIGLARPDRWYEAPRVNTRLLLDFIIHGVPFVFHTRYGELTRGIATSFAAPVLEGSLFSSGEHVPVWPDARGKTMGLTVEPLFKTAVLAARRDPEMYALLALVDAVRLGQPRERNLAIEALRVRMELK